MASKQSVETVEERRAARKAKVEADRAAMYARDLEAVDAIEVELGDVNVATLEVSGGPVALVAVRCPTAAEVKRFQSRMKGDKPDAAAAVEEIGRSCAAYPARGTDQLESLIGMRPGLLVLMGAEALKLSGVKAAAAGNG